MFWANGGRKRSRDITATICSGSISRVVDLLSVHSKCLMMPLLIADALFMRFHQTILEITDAINTIDLSQTFYKRGVFFPPPPFIYANVCRCTHHEGDGEVMQSGGRVIMVQVGVQVP